MTSPEERKRQYRSIFELFNRESRIYIKYIALKLKIDPNTASNRLSEAIDLGYVLVPQVRKCSFESVGLPFSHSGQEQKEEKCSELHKRL